jgi:hypothetical protein
VAQSTYYFSTHGWSRLFSCLAVGAFDEVAVAAAAAFRALISKKFAIVWMFGVAGFLNWPVESYTDERDATKVRDIS